MGAYNLVTGSPAQPVLLVDTSGNPYTASGGSGSLSNVNLSQINGVAPSLTNPLYTAVAEAADTTGTFTNGTQTTSVTNSSADGFPAALVSINGTYGTASGVFEVSDDNGTTWYPVLATRADGTGTETGYTGLTNTNRQWVIPIVGNDSIRVRSTAVASGTVNVRVGVSAASTNQGNSQLSATGLNVTITPTIQNAQYVSGNNMGGLQTVTFGSTQSVLNQVTLASQGGLATAKEIYVFAANPTASTFTDKGTFTIATADLSKLVAAFSLTPTAPARVTYPRADERNMGIGVPSGGIVHLAIVETATETPDSTTDLDFTL